jgi:UDP-GlcNAc:undecaprenyl-phosphate GlcNAc-1-phosphate transferase
VVVYVVGFNHQMLQQSAALLVGATLLLAFGLWDDRNGMNPRVKLAGQLCAGLVVIASGMRFSLTGFWLVDVLVSLLWIVGLSNAVNLLDNMDGLSSGLVAISAVFLFLLAASEGQFLVASMAAALTGACLGFLRYNFSPASIFMGDAGSLFLGFTLAVLGLKLRLPLADHVAFLVVVLVLAVPILDTTLVTTHRIANGRPVSLGGQDHCSHRLVALGLSRRSAVLSLYLLSISYGLLALAVYFSSSGSAWVVTALAMLMTLLVFSKLGSAVVYPATRPPAALAEGERRPDAS